MAVDPVRQIMVGTPAFLAFTFQLIPRPDALANVVSVGATEHWNENRGAAYAVKIGPFLSPIGLPCQAPPWGAIAGVDLRTGQRAWMHRHSTVRDLMPSCTAVQAKQRQSVDRTQLREVAEKRLVCGEGCLNCLLAAVPI